LTEEAAAADYQEMPYPAPSSKHAARAIALGFFQRRGHSRHLPPPEALTGLPCAMLVPCLESSAAEWVRGEGPWSGTPPSPLALEDFRGPPILCVTDNGAGSGATIVLELRAANRADYRGRAVLVSPKMVVARLHKLMPDFRGQPGAAPVVTDEPLVLTGSGPRGATRARATGGGLLSAVSMALSLALDDRRRWERVRYRGAFLDVPSALGGSERWTDGLPYPAEGAAGAAELAAAAFDPGGSRPPQN
jgi:hypothetical protein